MVNGNGAICMHKLPSAVGKLPCQRLNDLKSRAESKTAEDIGQCPPPAHLLKLPGSAEDVSVPMSDKDFRAV